MMNALSPCKGLTLLSGKLEANNVLPTTAYLWVQRTQDISKDTVSLFVGVNIFLFLDPYWEVNHK